MDHTLLHATRQTKLSCFAPAETDYEVILSATKGWKAKLTLSVVSVRISSARTIAYSDSNPRSSGSYPFVLLTELVSQLALVGLCDISLILQCPDGEAPPTGEVAGSSSTISRRSTRKYVIVCITCLFVVAMVIAGVLVAIKLITDAKTDIFRVGNGQRTIQYRLHCGDTLVLS